MTVNSELKFKALKRNHDSSKLKELLQLQNSIHSDH
jgi:hypothetical protein